MGNHRYTSRLLRAIAFLWLVFPITYMIYAALALGLNTSGLVRLLLSPGFWFVSSIAFVAARGILRLHWYGWYAFLFSNFTVLYQTAVALAYYSESEFRIRVFLATGITQLLLIYLVGREVRVPYFFPRIRWWESDPRYKLSVPATLSRAAMEPDQDAQKAEARATILNDEIEGEILDISLSGCFVKTVAFFRPDERITLQFRVFEKALNVTGLVVWRTESTVTHPKGIGVKFEALGRENALCLRAATKKLKKLARMYSQMTRERNWKEYLQREQRYQAKGGTGLPLVASASRDSAESDSLGQKKDPPDEK